MHRTFACFRRSLASRVGPVSFNVNMDGITLHVFGAQNYSEERNLLQCQQEDENLYSVTKQQIVNDLTNPDLIMLTNMYCTTLAIPMMGERQTLIDLLREYKKLKDKIQKPKTWQNTYQKRFKSI